MQEWENQCLQDEKLAGYSKTCFNERLTVNNADNIKDAEIVSVFIYSFINKEILDKLPNLKLICTRSTGHDHIDIQECKKRGILVSNVPHYGENTVAEHAFGLILSLSRNIYKAYTRTTKMDFSFEGLLGFDLYGKTIGVVGAGRIGLHVVRIAKGFGMNVVVYDPRQDSLIADVLGFKYLDFEELLKTSDVISLHVPLLESTKHLINGNNINLIKNGAIIINTSRGGILETSALIKALDEGIIAGAGLDVFEGEESLSEDTAILVQKLSEQKLRDLMLSYTLLHRDNVVITPHIAFYSEEALHRIVTTTHENILAFLDGHPINLVTK